MRQLLIAAAVFIVSGPAMAQWGGGDGSQAGATAWCAARAAGKSPAQASRAASNALVNSMGGSFTSNIATIITGGSTMRDSLEYLIRKQCPEYLDDNQATQSDSTGDSKNDANSFWTSEMCAKYPDAGKENCKATTEPPAINSSKKCNKAIEQYDCSYQKYLSANPNVANWAKQNPAAAKKEAVRLGAVDADTIEASPAKETISKTERLPAAKEIESKCLKAVDYKGCMEYNSLK